MSLKCQTCGGIIEEPEMVDEGDMAIFWCPSCGSMAIGVLGEDDVDVLEWKVPKERKS